MTETPAIRTVIVDREFAYPPERLWRALTTPHLLAEWLMQTDFAPHVGHAFQFTSAHVDIACRVLAVTRQKSLSYSWDAFGLESTVTFTLTPTAKGTHLRMEQTGFKPDQTQAFHGARVGWTRFFAALDDLLGRTAQ